MKPKLWLKQALEKPLPATRAFMAWHFERVLGPRHPLPHHLSHLSPSVSEVPFGSTLAPLVILVGTSVSVSFHVRPTIS